MSIKIIKLLKLQSVVGLLLVSLFTSNVLAAKGSLGLNVEPLPELSTDLIKKGNPLRIASLDDLEKRRQNNPLDDGANEKYATSWAFYLDNDLFVPGSSDRDYTGGISLTLSGKRAADYWFSTNHLLHWIDKRLSLTNENEITLHSFEAGLTIFTPDDTKATAVISDDRPYSSLVYISNTREQVNPYTRNTLVTTLTMGVLGLKIGENIQNGIHRITDSEQANGWENQISDGGELTFRYGVASETVLSSLYKNEGVDYEIITTSKASVGYLTDVAWGMSARLGRLNSPWWSFKPQLSEYSEKSSPLSGTRKETDELYFWTGFNLRVRAYNALLQGQVRDSAISYSKDELKYVVGELWVGITRKYSSGLRLSYFIRGQTSEIKNGPGSRNPVWGGLIISQAL